MENNHLIEIENFAYCYLTVPEIAVVTGIAEALIRDEETPEHKAFITGRLKRKAEFNDKVIKLSNQLSSPAMAIESKIAESVYLNDLKKR